MTHVPHPDILRKIAEILSSMYGFSRTDISPEMMLRTDLGLDSLDIVELVMMVEKEFHTSIDHQSEAVLEVTVSEFTEMVNDALQRPRVAPAARVS